MEKQLQNRWDKAKLLVSGVVMGKRPGTVMVPSSAGGKWEVYISFNANGDLAGRACPCEDFNAQSALFTLGGGVQHNGLPVCKHCLAAALWAVRNNKTRQFKELGANPYI